MTISRLQVLTGAFCVAACAATERHPAQAVEPYRAKTTADLMTQLVNTNYFNVMRLSVRGGEFFSHDFKLTRQKREADWSLQRGSYNKLRGYWVFLPSVRKCWQAVNANGPLRYWNEDGAAQAGKNPEDWELFLFEPIDLNDATIKIRNVYGRYIRYHEDRFICDAPSIVDGTTFVAQFN